MKDVFKLDVLSTFHRKDDNWKLSQGVSVFLIIGLLLLLSAISAVIIIIKPWTVSKACYNALVYISFWL